MKLPKSANYRRTALNLRHVSDSAPGLCPKKYRWSNYCKHFLASEFLLLEDLNVEQLIKYTTKKDEPPSTFRRGLTTISTTSSKKTKSFKPQLRSGENAITLLAITVAWTSVSIEGWIFHRVCQYDKLNLATSTNTFRVGNTLIDF